MANIYKIIDALLFKNDILKSDNPAVIVEKPVTLYVNGTNWLTFMCSPKYLKELAAGFLFNEGIIDTQKDIRIIEVGKREHNIDVWLSKNIDIPKNWRRTSGCAGGYTAAIISENSPVQKSGLTISPNHIQKLFSIFLKNLDIYKEVGGIHSSGISDGKNILNIIEDIGRHNTLDKISGMIFLNELIISPLLLFTTGRVSSDMVQKAAKMNATLIISRTSPTTLSIEIAKSLGIGLIGYARGKRFTIYTIPNNIKLSTNKN